MIFTVNTAHIWSAYRLLKSHAYYENLNLFIKNSVAQFEKNYIHRYTPDERSVEYGFDEFKLTIQKNPEHPFNKIIAVLNDPEPERHPYFQDWLGKIDFRLCIKNVKDSQKKNDIKDGGYLTNKRTDLTYSVDKVNYFIEAPIELHILDMLWSALVGTAIDNKLTDECLGNRLSDNATHYRDNFYNNNSNKLVQQQQGLFKQYIGQYNKWRDGALTAARTVVDSQSDTAIFSLDIKSYYYNINFEFNDVRQILSKEGDKSQFELKLCDMLEAIHAQYYLKIKPYMAVTHKGEANNKILPIGFSSSSIIANLYLSDLDLFISKKLQPAYYGRYVDDLIFVFKNPIIEDENTVTEFIKTYFAEMMEKKKDNNELYQLNERYHCLPIQGDKLKLYYFDKNHTLAGLDVFQKELEERSSAFRFLPDEHIDSDFEKFAYDILYDGSANKFRSIVGLAENETELSKYLSSQIIAHRLCQITPDNDPVPKIKSFFKGRNALRFNRLWEKVFSYALIKGGNESIDFVKYFYDKLVYLINNTSFFDKYYNDELTKKLKKDLLDHLAISICLPFSLLDNKYVKETLIQKIVTKNRHVDYESRIDNLRVSNLFRHSYIAWPLMNYTDHNGSLCDPNGYQQNQGIKLLDLYLDLSPRFIHFEEWQVFHAYEKLHPGADGSNFENFVKDTTSEYKDRWFQDDFPIHIIDQESSNEINNNNIQINEINIKDQESSEKIKVAIANLKIEFSDIEKAYSKDIESGVIKPNVGIERQKTLFGILNEAEKHKVKLLVLPEVSIPVSWLPFMVSHARRHQIALVFGLEHWVVGDNAYNLIIEALPFKVKDKYNSCLVTMRVKNHYAPLEKEKLKQCRLIPAEPVKKVYNLNNWHSIGLASYNCYELANIEHRSLFRSKIQILAACVWNKDTSYYDHILESASRDLFCYVIQSNTSQFGGSCVLQPSSSIKSQIIKVKGGDNGCILVTELNIKELKEYQYKSIRGESDTSLKATPPGYDHDYVWKNGK